MASIQHSILYWFDENKRDLPWRESKNPYSVWISEIILQQTRVEQGKPYYDRFMNRFPSVFDLANADEEDVLLAWKGLGYYTRARNIHKCAKAIVSEYGGNFPQERKALLNLPGIGEYTAAAIASICWDQPYIALDGNIIRIVSRIYNIDRPFTQSLGKAVFKTMGQELVSKERPGDFNQALMDLGASICLPKSPRCDQCPILGFCEAKKINKHQERPVKLAKRKPINRFLLFFVHHNNKKLSLIKQENSGIWQNLYLFPYVEFPSEHQLLEAKEGFDRIVSGTHLLSHQRIHYVAIKGERLKKQEDMQQERVWLPVKDIENLPIPRLMAHIFEAWLTAKTQD